MRYVCLCFQLGERRGSGSGSVEELSSTFRWAEQTCPGFSEAFVTEILEQLASHTLSDRELRAAKDTLTRSAATAPR